MAKKHLMSLCVAMSALSAGNAMALTVWDNGGPAATNLGGSYMSDTQQAQDFVLTSTTDLTSVTFWNLQAASSATDYLGSIFYQITNNASGAPGATIFGSGTATPTRTAAGSVLGFDQFKNDFSVSVNSLVAGTYWITLHNGALSSTAFNDFSWSWADLNAVNTPTTRGQEFLLNPLDTQWRVNDQEHAFNISGVASVVPEPTAWLLGCAGLAALSLRRRHTV